MRDAMAVDTGLHEVRQCARPEVEKDVVIRAHQISGRRASRMHISPGTENGQTHRQICYTARWLRSDTKLIKNCLSFYQVRVGALLMK